MSRSAYVQSDAYRHSQYRAGASPGPDGRCQRSSVSAHLQAHGCGRRLHGVRQLRRSRQGLRENNAENDVPRGGASRRHPDLRRRHRGHGRRGAPGRNDGARPHRYQLRLLGSGRCASGRGSRAFARPAEDGTACVDRRQGGQETGDTQDAARLGRAVDPHR